MQANRVSPDQRLRALERWPKLSVRRVPKPTSRLRAADAAVIFHRFSPLTVPRGLSWRQLRNVCVQEKPLMRGTMPRAPGNCVTRSWRHVWHFLRVSLSRTLPLPGIGAVGSTIPSRCRAPKCRQTCQPCRVEEYRRRARHRQKPAVRYDCRKATGTLPLFAIAG
jgi:hypothetical protein